MYLTLRHIEELRLPLFPILLGDDMFSGVALFDKRSKTGNRLLTSKQMETHIRKYTPVITIAKLIQEPSWYCLIHGEFLRSAPDGVAKSHGVFEDALRNSITVWSEIESSIISHKIREDIVNTYKEYSYKDMNGQAYTIKSHKGKISVKKYKPRGGK